MKKKQMLAFALIGAMALAGCGGSGGSAAPAESKAEGATQQNAENTQVEADASTKDTLIIANTAGEPGNLHPFDMVSIGATVSQVMIYEGLVYVDTTGDVQPLLADTFEVADDAITFHLREGVTFSNGDPVTVEDVEFSFNLMMNSNGGKAGNYAAADMENATFAEDGTIVVPMKDANTAQIAYFEDLFIVDKKEYEAMGDDYQFKPVATGPFVVSDWVVGDHITLTANENYWDGAPLLKEVVVRTIAEASQALIEVETGGADVMISPNGADVERVLNGEIKGVKAITESTMVLRNNNVNFNHNSQYFSDKKLREAVARVIDRASWTSIISPGVGTPAYCAVASGVWGWYEGMEAEYPYTYDLEAAKQLVIDAGYPDGFTCTILTDMRPYHQALIELLQASLSQIGITLDVQSMELNKQKEIMVTGEGYDMYILDNVGNPGDPLSCLWRDSNPEFSGDGGSNYLRFTMEKEGAQEYYDKLIAVRSEVDNTKKAELCKELEQQFTENLMWIPVNSIQSYLLANENLQNVSFSKDIIKVSNKTCFN